SLEAQQEKANLNCEVLVQKRDINRLQGILQRESLLPSHLVEYLLELQRLLDIETFCRGKLPIDRRQTYGKGAKKAMLALTERTCSGRHVIFGDLQEPIALVLR